MNTRPYIAIYRGKDKGKKIVVHAKSSFEAQEIAAKQFKAKKSYQVIIMLADITHSTAAI